MMDKAIELALKTWYDKDNPLHLDPLHPAIKLAGEAGELLDLYGKDQYKPGFSWWDCEHCGYGDASHTLERCPYISQSDENILRGTYTPLVLDELGDLWYYVRILAYQLDVDPGTLAIGVNKGCSILQSLSWLSVYSSQGLNSFLLGGQFSRAVVGDAYRHLLNILKHLDTDLDHLTELNYQKLNSDPTNHGWKGA